MGVLFSVLSVICFSSANVTINRGGSSSKNSGVFLSILITLSISFFIWIVAGWSEGWAPVNLEAVLWFALAGILTIFIGRAFLYASVQSIGAIKASAVKRLNPFFSVLLGGMLLGEELSAPMIIGMMLIFLSFFILIKESLDVSFSSLLERPAQRSNIWKRVSALGYFYGPVSAFAYASGYVARKQGLILLSDAAFGTFVGALAGAVFFLFASKYVDRYKMDVISTFRVFNPWMLAAGFLSSFGQIFYFSALNYSSLSKIALITSMEVFMTMFLSVIVFRSGDKITFGTVVAACIATLGTLVVILS